MKVPLTSMSPSKQMLQELRFGLGYWRKTRPALAYLARQLGIEQRFKPRVLPRAA